jgi:subtilase family serine protease
MNDNLRRLLLAVCATAGTAWSQNFVYPMNPPYIAVAGPNKPGCGTLPSRATLICYLPATIRAAYNFDTTFEGVPLAGNGQTIAIVEAFGSPTLVPTGSPNYSTSDLAKFDAEFAIQDPPSLSIVCPQGCPVFNPHDTKHNELGWALETMLDVEYAHAMAPGANILVVVATTSTADAINAAIASALSSGANILFQSFGEPEYLIHPSSAEVAAAHANYEQAQINGITVLAAAGDLGAANGNTHANASFPASDPLVLAVGGTEGLPYPGGLSPNGVVYGGEQVWNEDDKKDGIVWATGGSPSLLFPLPPFQTGLNLTSRTIPDVSFNAALNGGVVVYTTALGGGWYVMGGTGAAVSQWAGVIAMVNEASILKGFNPLGYINPAIYSLAQGKTANRDFHDITVGDNVFGSPVSTQLLTGSSVGFLAKPGYDAASGWGTPNVANFVVDLVNAVDQVP